MRQRISLGITIWILFLAFAAGNVRSTAAYSKDDLVEKIKNQTSDTVERIYYADYDNDGAKEAFVITRKSKEAQTLWFTGAQEVKKIATAMLWTASGAGICPVDAEQKLFVAEGSYGGSSSWSYCLYVKDGRAVRVKRAGSGLKHTSGKEFVIYPGAFDAGYGCDDGLYYGHTYKEYYLRWTGTKFVEYCGKTISRAQLKKYQGADKYLRKAKKLGYQIGKIYYRENGIINVNVSQKYHNAIEYDNFSLDIRGKRAFLRIVNKKGNNIIEKSGYGGIYRAKGFSA